MFRRIFGRRAQTPEAPQHALLSEREAARIGTQEDPLLGYEEALERNFRAMEAERAGDPDHAVRLYETNVAAGFVGSHPYERLALIYEARRAPAQAIRVLETYVALAGSGDLPPGAQRSADRKLPQIEARLERLRRRLRETAG